jgi:hypothetical protein
MGPAVGSLLSVQSCRSCGQVSWGDAPVNALAFLEAVPVLVSADSRGIINAWCASIPPY